MKRVAVKFCGHCNPQMEMTKVYQCLCKLLPEIGFVYYAQQPEADLLLVLNACASACVSLPPFHGPVLVFSVSEAKRSGYDVMPEAVAGEIAEEIERTLNREERRPFNKGGVRL